MKRYLLLIVIAMMAVAVFADVNKTGEVKDKVKQSCLNDISVGKRYESVGDSVFAMLYLEKALDDWCAAYSDSVPADTMMCHVFSAVAKLKGDIHFSDNLLDITDDEVLKWYDYASRLGDSDASLIMFGYNNDYKRDEVAAVSSLSRAKYGNLADALYFLGDMLYPSDKISYAEKPVRKDSLRAVELLKEAAALGQASAIYRLSTISFAAKDYKAAVDWLRHVNEPEYYDRYNIMRRIAQYMVDNGSSRGLENCLDTVSNAEQCDAYFLSLVAYMAIIGEDRATEAFELLEKSHSIGTSLWQECMAWHYACGWGVKRNYSKAEKMLRKNPTSDNVHLLGWFYSLPKSDSGKEPKMKEAIGCFKSHLETDQCAECAYKLGNCIINGECTDFSKEMGEWFVERALMAGYHP